MPVTPSAAPQCDRAHVKVSFSSRKSKGFDAHGHQKALLNPGDARAGCG